MRDKIFGISKSFEVENFCLSPDKSSRVSIDAVAKLSLKFIKNSVNKNCYKKISSNFS